VDPIRAALDSQTGIVSPAGPVIERRLSDMRGYYLDADAEAALAAGPNPRLYRVYPLDVPEQEGQVLCGATVIEPGRVGKEYFMTKGHFHENDLSAEVYHTLSGRGYLLMETHDGRSAHAQMASGSVCYIPPGWAHRTVNVGADPLVFFYAMPGDAGHDYRAIEEQGGFRERVLEQAGRPTVVTQGDAP